MVSHHRATRARIRLADARQRLLLDPSKRVANGRGGGLGDRSCPIGHAELGRGGKLAHDQAILKQVLGDFIGRANGKSIDDVAKGNGGHADEVIVLGLVVVPHRDVNVCILREAVEVLCVQGEASGAGC